MKIVNKNTVTKFMASAVADSEILAAIDTLRVEILPVLLWLKKEIEDGNRAITDGGDWEIYIYI